MNSEIQNDCRPITDRLIEFFCCWTSAEFARAPTDALDDLCLRIGFCVLPDTIQAFFFVDRIEKLKKIYAKMSEVYQKNKDDTDIPLT